MPALESRRVRTQPLTVTGTSGGARPARISRVLNSFPCIDRELQRQSDLSSYCPGEVCDGTCGIEQHSRGDRDVLRGFAPICALLLDPAAVALTPTAASARTRPAPTQIIQREARPLAAGLGARLAFRATQSLNAACCGSLRKYHLRSVLPSCNL